MKTKTRKFPCGCDDTIKGLANCSHKEMKHTPTPWHYDKDKAIDQVEEK